MAGLRPGSRDFTIKITSGNAKLQIHANTHTTSARQVVLQVANLCCLKPETVKVIAHGVSLTAEVEDSLLLLGFVTEKDLNRGAVKAIVVASTEADIAQVKLDEERAEFVKKTAVDASRFRKELEGNGNFGALRELPHYNDCAEARALLQRLAVDKGIWDVMKKYGWQVGTLSEMEPQGLAGVDPVVCLGVNINAGQEISLRLRTDDLKGFRNYERIKDVLCHELAHNVHSDHSNEFLELESFLKKESRRLDWRNAPMLGGSKPRDTRRTRVVQTPKPKGVATSGATEDNSAVKTVVERQAHAPPLATINTATSANVDSIHGSKTVDAVVESTSTMVADVAMDTGVNVGSGSSLDSLDEQSCPSNDENMVDTDDTRGFGDCKEEGGATSINASVMHTSSPPAGEEDARPVLPGAESANSKIDQLRKLALPGAESANSKIDQLRRLVSDLVRDGRGDEAAQKSLHLIRRYVQNARLNEKVEKYRRIRMENRTFAEYVGARHVGILEAVGFRKEETDGQPMLVLKAFDPVALWMAEDVLGEMIAV